MPIARPGALTLGISKLGSDDDDEASQGSKDNLKYLPWLIGPCSEIGLIDCIDSYGQVQNNVILISISVIDSHMCGQNT